MYVFVILSFRSSGAIFMNDQEQFDENRLSHFLFNILPTLSDGIAPEIYDYFRINYINENWSQWKGESALVAIDKTNHAGDFFFQTKNLEWTKTELTFFFLTSFSSR